MVNGELEETSRPLISSEKFNRVKVCPVLAEVVRLSGCVCPVVFGRVRLCPVITGQPDKVRLKQRTCPSLASYAITITPLPSAFATLTPCPTPSAAYYTVSASSPASGASSSDPSY
eukprot:scaffold3030_cov72-Cyclotella_meneghiniana.AAC.15